MPKGFERPQGTPPEFWAVFDLHANKRKTSDPSERLPRQHQTNAGRIVNMFSDLPCFIPEAEARPFLRDGTSYEVFDQNGDHVLPFSEVAQQRYVPEHLEPDHVVAALHELHIEALIARAAMFPGGSLFHTASPRQRVISFITTAQQQRDRVNSSPDDAPLRREAAGAPMPEVELEDFNDEEAAALVPGQLTIPAGA